MDDFEGQESQSLPGKLKGKPSLIDRIGNALEVLLVALFGSILVPIGFSIAGFSPHQILGDVRLLVAMLCIEATVTLLAILGLLTLRGQRLRELGWNQGNLGKETLTGLLFVPLLFLTVFLVTNVFRILFPELATEENPLLELIKSPRDVALMLISSVYVGGFKEEIQRAFILERFRENLGGALPGLLLWSAFFGYGHVVQGIDNAVGAGLLGLLFGLLYLWRRSLTAPIVAHAAYDVLTVTIFWNFFVRP